MNHFCWFEIIYIIKSVIYSNIYHMALHMSKLIDVAPDAELRVKLRMTQKELTKSMTALELLLKNRPAVTEEELEKEKEAGKQGEKVAFVQDAVAEEYEAEDKMNEEDAALA